MIVEASASLSSIARTSEYHSSYGLIIHCTPLVSNFVLLSVKAIFAVVSGVLLIQTNIFIFGLLFFLPLWKERVRQIVVYATNAKISAAKIVLPFIVKIFCNLWVILKN